MKLLSYHEAKQQAEENHQAILLSHPDVISKAYNKVLNTEGDKAIHNALIELGSETLKFLTCIAAWEFRHFNQLNEKVDALFFELKTGNITLGKWLGVFREAAKANETSILSLKITDKVSDLIACSVFNKVFDDLYLTGIEKLSLSDNQLPAYFENSLKNISANKINILDFFDKFVKLRNAVAHETDKSISLGESFYRLLNPYLLNALIEINELFTVLKDYHYATYQSGNINNDGSGFTLKFSLTLNNFPSIKSVNVDSFNNIPHGTEFLLDRSFKPYIKFSPTKLPPPHPDYKPQENNSKPLENNDPLVTMSQVEKFALYTANGESLYDKEQYAEAKIWYQKALDLQPDDTYLLLCIASCLDEMDESDSLPYYERILAINEKKLGKDHPDLVTNLDDLAEIYSAQERYKEAESLYQRSLEINEKAFKNDTKLAQSLENLADLYYQQERYGDAEPLYQRSLKIKKIVSGNNHPDIAVSSKKLALLYVTPEYENYEEAEQLFKKCLSIEEKHFGKDHLSICDSLTELASLYLEQCKYDDAEQLFQRCLDIKEKELGKDHLDVANCLENLALAKVLFEDAEPLYQRSLAIKEKALGKDHPEVIELLNDLDELYKANIVSLTENATVNLTTQVANLESVAISLGCDAGEEFDLDSSAFLLKTIRSDAKVRSDEDFIFYNQPKSSCGSVEYEKIDDDDRKQRIKLNLLQIPPEIKKIAFCVSIHDADARKQNFGQMSKLYIRVINLANNREIAHFDLPEASTETAMVFGEIYRWTNDWKFKAIGQGFADGLGALATSFGVDVDS
jgi:stress response protein SCP2